MLITIIVVVMVIMVIIFKLDRQDRQNWQLNLIFQVTSHAIFAIFNEKGTQYH